MTNTIPESTAPKSVAIIYNSNLPDNLGGLGEYIANHEGYFPTLNTTLIDIKSFILPSPSTDAPTTPGAQEPPTYDHQAFQTIMSTYAGYIFVFPSHIWSHTAPLKHLISHLPRNVYANKPTALLTYAREDVRPWDLRKKNASHDHIPRNSAPMMAEYLSQLVAPEDTEPSLLTSNSGDSTRVAARTGRRRGFTMVEMSAVYENHRTWPEFVFFYDIWDSFLSRNIGWPGGNQIEAWEEVRGRCIALAGIMKGMIEGGKVGEG